jgi:hypothetical protein
MTGFSRSKRVINVSALNDFPGNPLRIEILLKFLWYDIIGTGTLSKNVYESRTKKEC